MEDKRLNIEKFVSKLIEESQNSHKQDEWARKIGIHSSEINRWKQASYPWLWDDGHITMDKSGNMKLNLNLEALYMIAKKFPSTIETMMDSYPVFKLIHQALPRKVEKVYLEELMKSSKEFFELTLDSVYIDTVYLKSEILKQGYSETSLMPMEGREELKDRFYESELLYAYYYLVTSTIDSEKTRMAENVLSKKFQLNTKIKEYLIKIKIHEFIANNKSFYSSDIINPIRIDKKENEKEDEEYLEKLLEGYERGEVTNLPELSQRLEELSNFLDTKLTNIIAESDKLLTTQDNS